MQRGVACKVAALDAWKTLLHLEFGSNCVCSLQGDPTSQKCPMWWGGGGGEGGGGVGPFLCALTHGRVVANNVLGGELVGWGGRSGSRQAGVAARRQEWQQGGRWVGEGWDGVGSALQLLLNNDQAQGRPWRHVGKHQGMGKAGVQG